MTAGLMNGKQDILREYFGHTAFRQGQEELIDALLSGRDVMGVMPTGAGKSMCYQIPALLLDGITVVVSPLISLMKDQVNSLIQSGVRAAYLNSSLTPAQYDAAISNAGRGMYKIIYVAPERLCTPSFLALAGRIRISLIAVDEAHCVSQWGQDFRPSYLKIPEFLDRLGYRPTLGAFTATATAQVRADMTAMLGLIDPLCVTTGFDRKNLYFGVEHSAEKLERVKSIIKEAPGRSGIIYCSTRKNVEEVCDKLNAAGIPCTRYHAGLSDAERRQNQDDFIYDRVRVIAATNAFGMGIDKSDVSFVIHYNMPKDIESYYQEAGRAGRDGSEARCILLYSGRDVRTNQFLIENQNDNPELDDVAREALKQKGLMKLRRMTDYCNTTGCLRQFILDYFGDKEPCTCGNCSACTGETELTDVTLEAQKILSCIYRLHQRNQRFGAAMIAKILKGSEDERIRQFDLTTLSTYGIMRDSTEVRIKTIIRYLTAEGYITEGDFHTLTLTRKSAEVLMQHKEVKMRLPAERRKKKAARKKRDGIYSYDTKLFDRLRNVRNQLALEIHMPAYIVMTDASLKDMCVKLPRNETELLEVSGVGRAKQEKFGRFFVAEIRSYLNDQPDTEKGKLQNPGDVSITEYVRAGAYKLKPTDREMSLSELCEDILTQLGVSAVKKPLRSAIKQWLISENYLTERYEDGKKITDTTILSEEAGILRTRKISAAGTVYTAVVYPAQAQEFVFENLEEIAALAEEEKGEDQ